MASRPDVLVITSCYEEEIAADGVELRISVHGSSLVTGQAALSKAREVGRLVEALAECGVDEKDVIFEGVHAEVSSGFLGKSSSSTYRLRIRCNDLERLPEVLGAVTGAKNARLEGMNWKYAESAEDEARWIQGALGSANVKAQAAAATLGARITGIHRVDEHPLVGPYAEQSASVGPESLALRAPGATGLPLGFDLSHRKSAGVRVTVEYRIEGFALRGR